MQFDVKTMRRFTQIFTFSCRIFRIYMTRKHPHSTKWKLQLTGKNEFFYLVLPHVIFRNVKQNEHKYGKLSKGNSLQIDNERILEKM